MGGISREERGGEHIFEVVTFFATYLARPLLLLQLLLHYLDCLEDEQLRWAFDWTFKVSLLPTDASALMHCRKASQRVLASEVPQWVWSVELGSYPQTRG